MFKLSERQWASFILYLSIIIYLIGLSGHIQVIMYFDFMEPLVQAVSLPREHLMEIFLLLGLVDWQVINPSHFGVNVPKRNFLIYYLFFIGTITVLVILATLFELTLFFPNHIPSPAYKIVFSVSNILFVSFVEEYVYRGVIQRNLSRFIDWRVAVIIVGVAFTLAHPDNANFVLYTGRLAMGVTTGYIYYKTGRVIEPMLFHSSVNLGIFFFTFIQTAL